MGGVRRAGPRGLSPAAILETALALLEEAGEAAFSLRKLAARVGCDPMAILHHFGSREGLERSMADALTAKLPPMPGEGAWASRLRAQALAYRALALAHPAAFGLLPRHLSTGPADFPQIEAVHRALAEAGVAEARIPELCLGWHAAMIGLCAAEIGGLIRPASPEERAEMAALPEADFPRLRKAAPLYAAVSPAAVFESMIGLLLAGLAPGEQGSQAYCGSATFAGTGRRIEPDSRKR